MAKQGQEQAGGDERSEVVGMVDLDIGGVREDGGMEDIGEEDDTDKDLRAAFGGPDDKGEGKQAGEKPGEQPPASEPKPEDGAKPEEKPAEASAEEAADEFEKIDKPTPDDWKRMREAYKAKKREAREAKEKADKGGGAEPKPENRAPAQPAPKPSDVDAAEVFKVYAEVVAGENEKVSRDKVESFIAQNLTPDQVAETVLRARRGEFGERSAEILALATEQLPMVQAMGGRFARQREEQAALQATREEALAELLTEYPEARNENSPQYQSVSAAVQELQTLVHPSVMTLPNAPRVVLNYMRLQKKVAGADAVKVENDRLKAEVETLRKQLGRPSVPPGGGGGKKPENGESADEWLSKQFPKE